VAEAAIVGRAIGMYRGLKPWRDSVLRLYLAAMMQLRNELATMRWRSPEASPAGVIRVPIGGYLSGGACTTASAARWLHAHSGLRVVMPSNAADACGCCARLARG